MKVDLKEFFIIALVGGAGLCILPAYAYDEIPITYSGTKTHVQFDGKWTYEYEWKESSLNQYIYDNGNKIVILRSAHQGNFIYILLDAESDETINLGADRAVVCFDTTNKKNNIPNSDDFCFMSILGQKTGVTYQGNTNSTTNDGFTQIPNPEGFIGISSASDKNDRYSTVPHATYEFRIPTDTIGRSDVYGFYFAVYDDNTKKYYTYPSEITVNKMISEPSTWGEIYSPDKSLPEFLPLAVLIPAFAFIILLSRSRNSSQR